jgi:signal transduction histidine kinase
MRHDEFAANAAAASGATAVTMARVDPAGDRAVCVGFGIVRTDLWPATLAQLGQAAPGYRPDRWWLPLSLSNDCRAAFTGGEVLVWPFGRIAAGQAQSPALDVFRDVTGFRYTVHTPVRDGGQLVGSLDFEFARRPSEATVRRAASVGGLAGILARQQRRISALERQVGRLRRAQLRSAAVEERLRADVAEVLHGRVQGRLLLATDRIARAQQAIPTDPARAGALLAAAADDLDQLRETEVRLASHRLHPAMIGAGLLPALVGLVERVAASVRVVVEVTPEAAALDGPLGSRVPAEVRLAAYRVAEEALANVVRHAGAQACEVLLGVGGGHLTLEVRDGGRGFEPATTRLGLGLLAARDRVEHLGGRLRITSAPGLGTAVAARLPL